MSEFGLKRVPIKRKMGEIACEDIYGRIWKLNHQSGDFHCEDLVDSRKYVVYYYGKWGDQLHAWAWYTKEDCSPRIFSTPQEAMNSAGIQEAPRRPINKEEFKRYLKFYRDTLEKIMDVLRDNRDNLIDTSIKLAENALRWAPFKTDYPDLFEKINGFSNGEGE